MEGRIIIFLDKPKVLYIYFLLYIPEQVMEGRIIISLDKPQVLYILPTLYPGAGNGGEDNYIPR